MTRNQINSYGFQFISDIILTKPPHGYLSSLTCRPGGKDCFSFSAFSLSVIFKVYRNREQRTLNLTLSAFFLILTLFASFLRAFSRKSLISLISRGIFSCRSESSNKSLIHFYKRRCP